MAITMTDSAVKQIKKILSQQESIKGLRVGVKKTGCSGYSYTIGFANEIEPDDALFEKDGVKVLIDKQALTLIDGTELDYRREGLNESFKFKNPNINATCGCGESFSV
ncbi:iron-sulfur cluster assembly accessory protein [Candidatus Nitrosoglobus terrae]|uniref:Iron-binding protein IscA n=1 Tax=Candidatus Nitrosoglobus terrae TaxID=1630141 RepID=A0A1Q2SML4_9GAMM|nr:iron-sulfur cluster assembly accessory protein [Candidatus Nitrosoglobus terrae]BAW80376.1 iron-sulfur cluster assembly accessory protein [Candidatus Nitrosoglobus terrae]